MKKRKREHLKRIARHGENQGGSKTGAGRERDRFFGYHFGCFHIVLLEARSDFEVFVHLS